MDTVIEVTGLRVTRGGRLVLPDLDLAVARGSIVGLLGPSGGGKSTVMCAVVGVQHIDSGRVRVLDLPAGDARLRHRVAYVTQAPSVYGDLTAFENVSHFATLLGCDDAKGAAAAALVAAPEVLVLDEPTVGLDPVLRRDLWALFRALADDGVTLLVSSHAMDEATHCDRLGLLREGRVLAQVRRDPRTIALMLVMPVLLMGLLAWIYADGPLFDEVGPVLLTVFPFVIMFVVTSVATLRERTSGTLERLLTTPLGKGDLVVGYALAFGLLAVVQGVVVTVLCVWAFGLDVAGPMVWLVLVDAANAVASQTAPVDDLVRPMLVIIVWIALALVLGSLTLRRRTP